MILLFIKRIPRARPGQIFPTFASISAQGPPLGCQGTLGQYAYIYILSDPSTTHTRDVRVLFGLLRIPHNSSAGGDSRLYTYNVGDHLGNACNNI